jgi:hypothetical protein
MEDNCYIYALVDLRDNSIRYIGKTKNINIRKKTHIRESIKSTPGSTKKNDWIRKVYSSGHEIDIIEIDVVIHSEWQYWEMFYIELFKTWGFCLTNMTKGGDGVDNPWKYLTSDQRDIRLTKLKQRLQSVEFREKQRLARLGKTYEEIYGEVRAKEMKRNKSEFLKKNNPSKKGRVNSEHNIQKSIKCNTKLYEITFPNGDIKTFNGQKEIITYFKEYINTNVSHTNHKLYVSPYAVMRNKYTNYKTIRK